MQSGNSEPGKSGALEELKVTLAVEARSPKQVLDDKDRHCLVHGDDHRPLDSWLGENQMVANLTPETESLLLEHLDQLLVGYRLDGWHLTEG